MRKTLAAYNIVRLELNKSLVFSYLVIRLMDVTFCLLNFFSGGEMTMQRQ